MLSFQNTHIVYPMDLKNSSYSNLKLFNTVKTMLH